MKDRTWVYEDQEYWNNLHRSRDRLSHEHIFIDGNDGESEFGAKIRNAVVGQAVLDVGCGTGEYTLGIANRAKDVVGVDFSEEAIRRAEKNLSHKWSRMWRRNCRFRRADANKLPFPDARFDIVLSMRGPVTSSIQSLLEAFRVLREGGTLMEITIGEKDRNNILRIFGRGQMYGITERRAVSKRRMLEDAGFLVVEIREYLTTEVFETLDDFVIGLYSSPIIPNFDVERDEKYLKRVEEECKTSRGIETEVHRVTIIATRPSLPRT